MTAVVSKLSDPAVMARVQQLVLMLLRSLGVDGHEIEGDYESDDDGEAVNAAPDVEAAIDFDDEGATEDDEEVCLPVKEKASRLKTHQADLKQFLLLTTDPLLMARLAAASVMTHEFAAAQVQLQAKELTVDVFKAVEKCFETLAKVR
jgi:hypothetical protein